MLSRHRVAQDDAVWLRDEPGRLFIVFVLVKRLLGAADPPRRHLLLLILDQFVDFSLASLSRAGIILGLDRHLRAETHINSFGARIDRLEGLLIRTCSH